MNQIEFAYGITPPSATPPAPPLYLVEEAINEDERVFVVKIILVND